MYLTLKTELPPSPYHGYALVNDFLPLISRVGDNPAADYLRIRSLERQNQIQDMFLERELFFDSKGSEICIF